MKRMNEKRLDKESLDWAGTVKSDYTDNGWVGSILLNFGKGGTLNNIKATVILYPGQRIKIIETVKK